MKTRLSQILAVAIVSLIGVLSANAQQMNLSGFVYAGDTLGESKTLKVKTGLKSKNGQFVAVMQEDGNFCLYKINNGGGGDFIQCTMTSSADVSKKGNGAWMSNDGSLKIVTNRSAVLWSSNTGTGDDNSKKGRFMVLQDDGSLIIFGRDNKSKIYDFKKGRM